MIFYFSATGNSQFVAERLSIALNEQLIDIADVARKKEFIYQLAEGEKVGFIFPVYFYGVPTIVGDFVKQLKLEGIARPYIFSVITYGGYIGAADRQFSHMLIKSGHSSSISFSILMPNNYLLGYELPSPDEQADVLAGAETGLKEIVDAVRIRKTGGESSGLAGRMTTAVSYPLYVHGRRTARFFAEDGCTGCALCERICPCGAIKMKDGRPEWVSKRCVRCLGCINRCPVAAIQYGSATKKRRRYVNPILK
jgi:NAD-dependent dihydropyrimidine dehydrogenase PreA subunit